VTTDQLVLRLRTDGVSWTPTDNGEVVVLDHATATFISANSSAAQLWRLLAQGSTESDLEAALVEAFAIDRAAAREDVTAFLADLRLRNLLTAEG
jgi:hypothetical protein